MPDNPALTLIKQFSSSLQNNEIDPLQAERLINDIHSHFCKLTDISGFDLKVEYLAAIPTSKGKALGLNHAAQCLLDYRRTVKFVKAILQAIKEKQGLYPGKVIQIFYAGCGPYAPFLTLIAPLFSSDKIQFTLLEINENSLNSAKRLIRSLNLTNFLKTDFLEDAVTVQVPDPSHYHILISETLDALLYRECYVPILNNLLPQFDPEVTLIPENVTIHLSLRKNADQQDPDEEEISTIFNVRDTLSTLSNEQLSSAIFPDVVIPFTTIDIQPTHSFILDTTVHIYKDIALFRNESSLTLPIELPIELPTNAQSLIFNYYLEPEVELKYRIQ
ncbi:phytanoyl-CoA dioxygenase [Algoriphagus lutimaris]|uniref:phytanoyl-CoA dioxygenase n=1 Tax=Algoriphagus lutimaris TaxID=613197 RepID=UPI00196B58C7|nr:phytanoyl-CoA dioxygenase [Algoriphagus lutimaris]MBN3521075.1 phytanoyl-CoA dioxygenase [Algoriphagus lutimaris]